MEISVEKYISLSPPPPPFHSVGIRRDFSSRSPRYSCPRCPWGTISPPVVNPLERKFACTRTKVQNHDFTGRRKDRSKEERERERGTVPFSMCHSCVLSGDTGNPAPPISPLELLNRGNRKGNPISREGGEPWIEEETTRTTRGRRKRVVVARASQLLENTDLSRSPNRLLFQISIQPPDVCIIEPWSLLPRPSGSFLRSNRIFLISLILETRADTPRVYLFPLKRMFECRVGEGNVFAKIDDHWRITSN